MPSLVAVGGVVVVVVTRVRVFDAVIDRLNKVGVFQCSCHPFLVRQLLVDGISRRMRPWVYLHIDLEPLRDRPQQPDPYRQPDERSLQAPRQRHTTRTRRTHNVHGLIWTCDTHAPSIQSSKVPTERHRRPFDWYARALGILVQWTVGSASMWGLGY